MRRIFRETTGSRYDLITACLFAFGGCLLLPGILLAILAVIRYVPLLHYQMGQCTITAKQLLAVETEYNQQTGPGVWIVVPTTQYKPDFQFVVLTADGHHYQAHGYDYRSSSSDQFSEQAILDHYTVGKTYPCWYDPANPSQAVLERFYVWDLVIVVFLLSGLTLCLIGVIRARRRGFSLLYLLFLMKDK